jgi:WD40 repeat protein
LVCPSNRQHPTEGQIIVVDVLNRDVVHTFDSGHGLVGKRKFQTVPLSESGGFNLKARSLPSATSSQKYEEARVRDLAVQGLPWSTEYAENYHRERQQIHHVVWLNGGLQFGTLDLAGTLRIWSASSFQLESQFDISSVPENSGSIGDGVAVTRRNALYCCKGIHLCHFDLEGKQLLHHVKLDERTGFPSRKGFQLSHDEQHLVIAGGSAVVTLWSLPNLELKWRFSDPLLRIFQAAAFSGKDEWLVLGTNTGDVFVLDSVTGRVVAERNAVVGASITALDISEDGTLAIGAADGQIRLIACDSLIKGMQLKGHRSHIGDLAVMPRLGKVITASDDRTAMLWDIGNLDTPIVLEGHSEGVGCVSVTKEQDIVATGGNDSQVILWRTADGQRICNRRTGTNIGLSEVAFSPNRTWVAACGNVYAWVWFLGGVEVYPFRTFRAEEDSVHEIVFDPSGEFLFVLHLFGDN